MGAKIDQQWSSILFEVPFLMIGFALKLFISSIFTGKK